MLYIELGGASLLPSFCGVIGHMLYSMLKCLRYLSYVVLSDK
jgi:hypothetical protein